jgi:hypothetical protein
MRSKVLMAAVLAILSFLFIIVSGNLTAEGSGSKECPIHMTKMEGKACDPGLCQRMKDHQAAINAAIEKLGEHLNSMKEIQNESEWREEMDNHMGMLQALLEEMQNCPMGDMSHPMMQGKMGDAGTESK